MKARIAHLGSRIVTLRRARAIAAMSLAGLLVTYVSGLVRGHGLVDGFGHVVGADLLAQRVASQTTRDGRGSQLTSAAPMNFVVRAGDYHGSTYVRPPTPPASFLVFTSEELALTLAVGNPGETDRSLATTATTPIQAFSVASIRTPPGATAPRLAINPVATLRTRGVTSDLPWARVIEIPSMSDVTWSATLVFAEKPVPGIYELQITPSFDASDPTELNPLGTMVRYEVREVISPSDRAELARRTMMHEYESNALARAAAAADVLLQVYPHSALAFQVKGEVARREGQVPQALEAFERAVQLMASGEDVLYRTHVRPHELERMIQTLSQTVNELRRRQ